MKLVAFRIKHFRSIIDTGWCNFSSDNITGLIGQNESGKSSVLEGLYSFYSGELEDDFIRSDGVYPEVNCSFVVTEDEMQELVNEQDFMLPKGAWSKIKKDGQRVNLRCVWTGLTPKNRTISLENKELNNLFDEASTQKVVTLADESEEQAEEETVRPTGANFAGAFFDYVPAFELFVDYDSLLPAKIDLADIVANKKIEGIKGAQNLLTIIGLSPTDLSGNDRIIGGKIRSANKGLTEEFQSFWSQYIGKSNKIEIEFELKHHDESETILAGKPYLTFWIKDGDELLYPAQRSKGVQWFLSFFLQLKASALLHEDGRILLIDEPGSCLHAKAQEDVLKLFEDIKDQLQIVYTTHSPYLIEGKKLYRLLAVQRANEDDTTSETKVLDIHKLGAASRDTLLPIYTLIGVSLQHQRVVKANNNVIIEEPSAYYYLQAFQRLTDEKHEMNFIPSTGVTNVPLLVNLFLGWGLEFIVVTDDDDAGKRVRRKLKSEIYGGDDTRAASHLLGIENCVGIEDIFTKSDFREFILGDKALSYSEENSKYISKAGDSKVLVAINFHQAVEKGSITLASLAKTTQANIAKLVSEIVSML